MLFSLVLYDSRFDCWCSSRPREQRWKRESNIELTCLRPRSSTRATNETVYGDFQVINTYLSRCMHIRPEVFIRIRPAAGFDMIYGGSVAPRAQCSVSSPYPSHCLSSLENGRIIEMRRFVDERHHRPDSVSFSAVSLMLFVGGTQRPTD